MYVHGLQSPRKRLSYPLRTFSHTHFEDAFRPADKPTGGGTGWGEPKNGRLACWVHFKPPTASFQNLLHRTSHALLPSQSATCDDTVRTKMPVKPRIFHPPLLSAPLENTTTKTHPPKSTSGHVSWVFPRGEPGSHSTVPCIPRCTTAWKGDGKSQSRTRGNTRKRKLYVKAVGAAVLVLLKAGKRLRGRLSFFNPPRAKHRGLRTPGGGGVVRSKGATYKSYRGRQFKVAVLNGGLGCHGMHGVRLIVIS